ncbi:MAG: hypothetical protein R3F37_05965 [Candidatus Competibacteraceae bacterium]
MYLNTVENYPYRAKVTTFAKRLCCASILGLIAGTAMAEDITVSEMTYKNNGAYNAFFNVRYNLDDGKNCTVYLPGQAFTGEALTAKQIEAKYGVIVGPGIKKNDQVKVDLTSSDFKVFKGPNRCTTNGKIPDGMRVWGKIDIDGGDEKSCKKSANLIPGSGGKTVAYRSSGTTLNNNSCKQSIN